MTFDGTGLGGLDYDICAYEGSRLAFRGPKVDLGKPYVSFLGSTETFGKYVERPFPTLMSAHLTAQVQNLGMINGGVDAYLGDPIVLDMARKANLRVVQVFGALNQTNHYFKVHPRRNDRFVGARETLIGLFPELDFSEFHFTKAMLTALYECSETRFRMVCQELQRMWLLRMQQLMQEIGTPTILVWISHQRPVHNAIHDPNDPMLVDAKMLMQLRKQVTAYVECVPDQATLKADQSELAKVMVSSAALTQVMGVGAHQNAAHILQDVCRTALSAK